ncbi:MAG: hypothetical protein WAN35_10720 [Terracidiphilus sp.]
MTQEELYRAWADPQSPWSDWVAPVLFAQLSMDTPLKEELEIPQLAWIDEIPLNFAVVLDLPGANGVKTAIALAARGYTPVPLYNASPGPQEITSLGLSRPIPVQSVVDMNTIADAIVAATPILSTLHSLELRSPVFLLDSNRLDGDFHTLAEDAFDNRWMVFPEDFPSASYFISHKIRGIVLVQQDQVNPQWDLARVLFRWQQSGIDIRSMKMSSNEPPRNIRIKLQSTFKGVWYSLLMKLGFTRSAAGGFGSYILGNTSAG